MKKLFCVLIVFIFALCMVFFTACRSDNKNDEKYYDDNDGWTPAYSIVIDNV